MKEDGKMRIHRYSFFTAISIVSVALGGWLFYWADRDPSPGHSRSLQPRLSGVLRWAPYHPTHRATQDVPTKYRDGIEESGGPTTTPRIAAAELLVGHTRSAVSALSALSDSASRNDKAVWNDLSVARFQAAIQYEKPELFADALAACDRALQFDTAAAEPLFNRALILERLGLRDDARAAWNHYLLNDGSSDWAVEARQHLRDLQPDFPFRQLFEWLPRNCAKERIQELVAHDPQHALEYGAMKVLGRWGEALKAGDPEADQHLRTARVLGDEIASINGDRFLQRAVAAIDQSTPMQRAALAAAHAEYLAGMNVYGASRPSEAEPILRRVANEFQRGDSPMAFLALSWAANAMVEQGHKDDGQRQLELLLTRVQPEFPSLRTNIVWEIGTCHASRGDWGEAIRLLNECATTFDRLHEPDAAGSVRRLIAFIYDRAGDSSTAWKVQMLSLRDIGRHSDRPLEKAVGTIADAAILEGKWRTAESFLTLQTDIARRIGHATHLTDALITRAVVRNQLRDDAGAKADRTAADVALAGVHDPAYRALYRAARLRLDALLSPSPAEKAALLTEVIQFQAAHSDVLNLPPLLLERGRARTKSGDVAGAQADFEQGIKELERHRDSLPAGEARWGAFHAAQELFDEAMALALDSGDVTRAFKMAERKRARSLLESYGPQHDFDARRLPPDVELVEFASLPSRLVTFVVDRAGGVRAVVTNCSRERLSRTATALSEAFRANDAEAMRLDGFRLHERLIAPVISQLAAPTVVFVPDETTATIPFSALPDEHGAYFIEQHPVVVAPSAAVYAADAERPYTMTPRRTVMILSNAAESEAGTLQFVDAEAARVAHSYARAIRLDASESPIDDLAKRASEADAIHFAGHAVGDDTALEPASILVQEHGRSRRIGVAEIAQLRLPHKTVVVLGGCNTARGETRAAEGVVSVAHGFLTAGARSVIAALWPIDDQIASSFFPTLHSRLANGELPAEALRAAQLDAIRSKVIPPSFWAALQDYGS
jgi:CHAT domain-containing protein